MSASTHEERWLTGFRRSLGYLRPHWRPMLAGLLLALGVSVFYTVSISSVVPLLKVIFADHETLADWLQREETERRLGTKIGADLPDDPQGLLIAYVDADSPAVGVLRSGDRLVAQDEERPGSYGLMGRIARFNGNELPDVLLRAPDGTERVVSLPLKAQRVWWGTLREFVGHLPTGRDAGSRLRMLALVVGALLVLSLLGGLCRFGNEALVAVAVQRAMHDVRSHLARHVLCLPMSWFGAQPVGDTLGRFANDVSKVEVGIWTLFGKTVREPLKALGVLVLTIAIDWRILVIAVLGIPVASAVIRLFGSMIKRAQRRASQSWGRLLDHLGERLAGVRVVKAYNMEEAEGQRFESEDRALTQAQTHIEVADAATKPCLEVLAMLAVGGFVLFGGSRVFHRELEPHLFFAAVVCLAGMFDPVRKLGNVNNRMQAADVAARRIFEFIDLPPETRTVGEERAAKLPPLRESIEFREVCFAYPSHPERLVLEDVTLRVEHGQVVALVGPNGSGKTTLMALLLRFYEPTRGRILIDGRDIAEYSAGSLRAQVGLVTQETIIFSDTVRANIAYGRSDATEEAIRHAARRANADEFITQLQVEQDGTVTRGYDARISSRTLSGGQRQRIALARAILRDPTLLVLDEATSQVDSESERRIQQALEDVTRDRTTFIIAHRFSTIARADLTVVMNEGRIVGVGRHDELLDSSPFYVTLCETQFAHGR